MDPSQFWIRFFLAALATWRVCHLLAGEDGPGGIMARLRLRLGRLADCFGCLSVAGPRACAGRRGRRSRPLFLKPLQKGAAAVAQALAAVRADGEG